MEYEHQVQPMASDGASLLNNIPQSCNMIERLMPEIRLLILGFLDLTRLQAIIRASPIFYQQYVHYQQNVLLQSFINTLGPIFVDAYTLHLARKHKGNSSVDITQFLKTYKVNTARKRVEFTESLSLTCEEITDMILFRLRFVQPFVDVFAKRTRKVLNALVGRETRAFRLSDAERMRFDRAAYRFQLLGQIASPRTGFGRRPRREDVSDFARALEPREVEELLSAYEFVCEGYSVMLLWYENRHSERGMAYDLNDEGEFTYDIGCFVMMDTKSEWDVEEWYSYLEGSALLGLPFFHDAVATVVDRNNYNRANGLGVFPRMERSFIPILTRVRDVLMVTGMVCLTPGLL
ncbi:hypothetical protein F5Y18DRAFT_373462 [Xylariaceae sp. FL1019]|nr:hypothetical protein F5Y18DRAFT_373462 [Xylariaceae sp. FL1019]